MKITFIITVTILWAFSLSANTEIDVVDLTSELTDYLRNNIDQSDSKTTSSTENSSDSKEAMNTLRAYVIPNLKSKKYYDALHYLNHIAGFTSDKQCLVLIDSLQEKISGIESDMLSKAESRVKIFREKLKNNLTKAKSTKELDSFLEEIEEIYAETKDMRNNPYREQIDAMRNIVSKWQTYLAYYIAGDLKQAGYELRNVASSLERTPIIPRSLVVELELKLKGVLNKTPKKPSSPGHSNYTAALIVDKIKGIDDVQEGKSALEKLLNTSQRTHAIQLLEVIKQIEQSHLLINNGDPLLGMILLKRIRTDWAMGVRSQLMLVAVKEATPKKYKDLVDASPVSEMIDQVALEMKSNRDWVNLWEYLNIVKTYLESVTYSSTGSIGGNSRDIFPSLENDIQALEKFIYAQKLKESGQLATALRTYTSVLFQTGRYGPYKNAISAIETLRGEFAKELYADQKKLAETPSKPPSASDMPYHRFPPRGYHDRPATIEQIENAIESKLSIYLANQEKNKVEQASRANDVHPEPSKQ